MYIIAVVMGLFTGVFVGGMLVMLVEFFMREPATSASFTWTCGIGAVVFSIVFPAVYQVHLENRRQ